MTALDPQPGEDRYVREFLANPVQRDFIFSKARADLFAARMGEGKSAALCWACLLHTRENPGARWAMIRDTWENLRDTTQKEFFDWFPPGTAGTYHASSKTFRWSGMGEVKGEVQWLGMDEEKDASKLQSRALGGFGMDEPAPAAHSGGIAHFVFTTAMSRLRQKGVQWYAAKLATNNPDETHWTYSDFVKPGTEGYACWQTREPENLANLPDNYYDVLRETYKDRPDLVDRFVEGRFGFQRLGLSVTPAWSDKVHLTTGLQPVRGETLHLLWDFGHNPTCLVTDLHRGHWRFLDALVGEEMGTLELIDQEVRPLLSTRYEGFQWEHIHDPADPRDQTSIQTSPVRAIRKELGGACHPGAVDLQSGIDALNHVLSQLRDGTGLVLVDKERAARVWWALRGGWHFPVRPGGGFAEKPVKNEHSHPGDAARYGASRLFPLGRLRGKRSARAPRRAPRYWKRGLGFERPGVKVPKEAEKLEGESTRGLESQRRRS